MHNNTIVWKQLHISPASIYVLIISLQSHASYKVSMRTTRGLMEHTAYDGHAQCTLIQSYDGQWYWEVQNADK